VVVKGELEILMAPDTKNELILNVLHEGEYLGEMSLIQPGGHSTASARARGEVVTLSMSRAQFKDLLKRHPHLANAMVRVLSQRLDNTNVATFRDLTEKNRQLQNAYDDLKAAQEQLIEKERMERELQVAAEIQMSILPAVLPPRTHSIWGQDPASPSGGRRFLRCLRSGEWQVRRLDRGCCGQGSPLRHIHGAGARADHRRIGQGDRAGQGPAHGQRAYHAFRKSHAIRDGFVRGAGCQHQRIQVCAGGA
jgi:hypothetical protein